MPRSFGITFDYLCPFARNGNEHIITALRAGADWDVRFVPYSLAQGHVEEGDTPLWDRDDPAKASGILALQVGLTVRDHMPEHFLDVHESLFAARHDDGDDIKDPAVLRAALTRVNVDAEAVLDIIADGTPLKVLSEEHEAGVRDYSVWGVPTFIAGGRGVFVRLMDRPDGDAVVATHRITTVLDLIEGEPMLHEFKQSDLPR